MQLVVDTNILFSFFKQSSFTRELIKAFELKLISPEYSISELEEHKDELLNKYGVKDIGCVLPIIRKVVSFIGLDEYAPRFGDAFRLADKLTEKELLEYVDDIDFFALSLKERCAIWSNDRLFKKISGIKIYNTKELVEYLRFSGELA